MERTWRGYTRERGEGFYGYITALFIHVHVGILQAVRSWALKKEPTKYPLY